MTINNNNYYYLELNKPADFVLETQLLCGFSTQKKMRNADFGVWGRYGEILSEFTCFLVLFFYGSCDKKINSGESSLSWIFLSCPHRIKTTYKVS